MELKENCPKFTIFIPVKNGRNYISPCVESILAQTYNDFDLVILGGHSTDGTCEWLKNLEARDTRIKIIFSDKELGIEGNWGRILSTQKNEFMTIVGYDDLLEPDFLEKINSLIQNEPNANLYLTHFKLIDSKGKLIRHCMPIPKYETAAEFLAARMAGIRDSFGTGYVMRSDHYDKFGGIPPFSNLLYADDALWLGLMGNSFKVTSPRVCFSYRLHSASVSGMRNPVALFKGLNQYLGLLSNMARENNELARVIKLYAPQHVARRSQYFYYHYLLVKLTPWWRRVDQIKLSELELLLKKFAPETALDKSYMRFSRGLCKILMAWLARKCN